MPVPATSMPVRARRRRLALACALLPFAGGLAMLALAQAAASVGVSVPLFAPFGPSFHAWRQDRDINRTGNDAPLRAALLSEPLSSLPLYRLALTDEARGDMTAARRQMQAANRITRRDPRVQLWLADDALRAGDVKHALGHYDSVLRTRDDLGPILLRRLAAALRVDAVRAALLPYAMRDNPWFAALLRQAAMDGHAGAAAAFLSTMHVLPDDAAWRAAYGALTLALASEGRRDLLHRLYPRLPGGNGPAALSDPAPEGYAPFRWVLADEADRSATFFRDPSGPALRIDVAPLTSGIVATRTVLPPDARPILAWRVARRTSGAESTALWSILCDDGTEAHTADLLPGAGTLAAPPSCRTARLRLIVNGGAGPERLTIHIAHLRWLKPVPALAVPPVRENPRHAS